MQDTGCRNLSYEIKIGCIFFLMFWIGISSRELCGNPAAKERPMSLFVIVDATPGWYTDVVASVLKPADIGKDPQLTLQFARFDQEPERPQPELPGAHTLQIPPGAPLREVMETCMNRLAGLAPETMRALVVIAHEESYPSWITTQQLLESARKSGVTIYAVSLAKRDAGRRENVFQRAGRALVGVVAWLGNGLTEGSSHSHGSTLKMLENLSDSTGGDVCHASTESDVHECADGIAAELRGARRGKQPLDPSGS